MPLAFYETPPEIAKFMVELINLDKEASIIDAGSGKGAFLEELIEKKYEKITAVEIDSEFCSYLKNKYEKVEVVNMNFLEYNRSKVDCIISNPPYMNYRQLDHYNKKLVYNLLKSKSANIYHAFIYKSVELLKDEGKLVYIVPVDFMYSTFSKKIVEHLEKIGSFEYIIFLGETRLFNNASIETIIFSYVKGKKIETKVFRNNKNKYEDYGYLLDLRKSIFEGCTSKEFASYYIKVSKHDTVCPLGHVAKVGVGSVSGADECFIVTPEEYENMSDLEKRYIYKFMNSSNYKNNTFRYYILLENVTEDFLKNNLQNIYLKLHKNKDILSRRYLPRNRLWFQWQSLRNWAIINKYIELPKIYVATITRQDKNSFVIVEEPYYPSGDLLFIIPYSTDIQEYKNTLYKLFDFLNSDKFYNYYKTFGYYKGGRRVFTQKILSEINICI